MTGSNETYVGEESSDEVSSLAPRPPDFASPRKSFGSKRSITIGICVAVVILGFFVVKAVGDAGLYFRTADEAVAQRESLGTKRFRLEGCVMAGSIVERDNDVAFTIAGVSALINVVHSGSPPKLFQANIPVVLDGKWSDNTFTSNEILVRHSETYAEQNKDRVAPSQCTSDATAARAK